MTWVVGRVFIENSNEKFGKWDVVYGNHLETLSETHKTQCKTAYDNGAFFIVVAPKDDAFRKFVAHLKHTFAVETPQHKRNINAEFCDVVVFNKDAHNLIVRDIVDTELNEMTVHTLSESWTLEDSNSAPVLMSKDSSTTKLPLDINSIRSITPYYWGLLCDDIIKFIEKYIGGNGKRILNSSKLGKLENQFGFTQFIRIVSNWIIILLSSS